MHSFKMICLDIDGTLLNSQHQISETTKKAIQATTNIKKIPIILVSARMPKGIIYLQQELNIAEPIICYSGALTLAKDSTVLANQVIPIPLLANILPVLQSKNVHISVYKDDEWYVEKPDIWSEQELKITNIKPTYRKLNKLLALWGNQHTGPNKLLCMSEPSTIQTLLDNITNENLNIYPSKPTYLEIMPKNSSKTSAIKFLLKQYKLDRTELMVIGDNYNDIDMLTYAGLGIAMGNAPNDVKKCADAVTFTNDEDGVTAALTKYVL